MSITLVGKTVLGRVPLAKAHLSDDEQGFLALSRHFLRTFEQPESQAWVTAFTIAVERFGDQGAQIALGLQGLIGALLKVRQVPFRYCDPLSLEDRRWILPEELALIDLLRALRVDATAQARRQIVLLTGGRMDPAVVRAGLILARRLPQEADQLHLHPPKDLRVVH